MPPVLDKKDYRLLIRERRDFIVCMEGKRKEKLFEDIFSRYAESVLVLVCKPENCPELVRSLNIKALPVVLLFSEGKLIDKVTDLGRRDEVFSRIDGFLRFLGLKENFFLMRQVFQRRSKKDIEILEELYYREVWNE